MRLHALELTAFGPFRGRERIDFDKVSASGLFMLEGPTGVGKTSVLDAITFALYGVASAKARSDFADPTTDTVVELEFSVRGRRYRIRRTPAMIRPGRAGKPSRVNPTATLHALSVDGTATAVAAAPAEVGAAITDIVGLTREQFTTVILLPQGEFATFLRAGSDDRRRLLTQLFGAGMFDTITEQLHRWADQARDQLASAVDRAHMLRAQLDGALDRTLETATDAAAALDPEVTAEAARAALDAAQADAARAAADLDLASAALAAAEHRSVEADRRCALVTDLAEAQAQLDLLLADEPAQAARLGALEADATARRAEEPLRRLGQAQRRVDAADVALREVAGAGPLPDVEMLIAAVSAAGAQTSALIDLAERERTLGERSSSLARAEADLADDETRRAHAHDERAALAAELERVDRMISDLAATAIDPATLSLAIDTARAGADAAAEVDQAQRAVRSADVAVSTARDVADQAAGAVTALYERRVSGMAGELAAGLREHAPCPVCGSADHPSPAPASGDEVTAEMIAAATRTRDEADRRARDCAEQFAAATATLTRLRTMSGGRPLEVWQSEVIAAEAAHEAALEHTRARAQALSRREELTGQLTEMGALLVGLDEQISARRAELARDRALLEQDQAAVMAARGSFPSVTARLEEIEADNRRATDVRARLEERAQAMAERDLARAEVAAATGGDADGALGLLDALLDDDTRGQQSAEADAWASSRAAITAQLETLTAAGADPAALPAAQVEQAEARDALTAARAAQEAAATRLAVAATRAASGSTILADLLAALDDVGRAQREVEPVERLERLARGGSGGESKMDLTTYVLRLRFDQMVAAANHELARISGGRFTLAGVDDPGDGRKKAGLHLRILDSYTGTQRPVESLSGGESFYTSLALALGLADVVRAEAGGIELDTLFIDEGFGALDPDTLEQVMGVIDTLRAGNKTVGIVSHVSNVKDWIPDQISVRRRADGSSTLQR